MRLGQLLLIRRLVQQPCDTTRLLERGPGGNAKPFLVEDGKIVCGTRVAQLSGLAIPKDSFGIVLRHSPAKAAVHDAQVELS